MVSHRLVGSITRSWAPATTLGALVFSASSSGTSASSASQSQSTGPGPLLRRYSQPRPTGGASVRMVSKPPPARPTAVAANEGAIRTRCWVVRVPARSA
jgi:hypothetical protein